MIRSICAVVACLCAGAAEATTYEQSWTLDPSTLSYFAGQPTRLSGPFTADPVFLDVGDVLILDDTISPEIPTNGAVGAAGGLASVGDDFVTVSPGVVDDITAQAISGGGPQPAISQVYITITAVTAGLSPASGFFATALPSGPAPEPSAWALMILGVGLAGGVLRWKRGRLTAPAYGPRPG